jgi:hypothetical protein
VLQSKQDWRAAALSGSFGIGKGGVAPGRRALF